MSDQDGDTNAKAAVLYMGTVIVNSSHTDLSWEEKVGKRR